MTYNWNTKAGGGGAAEGPEFISKLATKAIKAIQSHVSDLHDAADDIESLVDGKKAGRTFSSANAQALRDHAGSLHDLADSHEQVIKHLKRIVAAADDLEHSYTSSYADNLANITQGSTPTYASPNAGVPLAGQQEGSGKHSRGTYETKEAVITESSVADALRQLQGIRNQLRAPRETFVEKQIKAVQRATQEAQNRFTLELAQAREEAARVNW